MGTKASSAPDRLSESLQRSNRGASRDKAAHTPLAWSVRVLVGVAGVLCLVGAAFGSGLVGNLYADATPQVKTVMVRDTRGGVTITTTTTTTAKSPRLSGETTLGVAGIGAVLVLISIAWSRVKLIKLPGGIEADIGEDDVRAQLATAIAESDQTGSAKPDPVASFEQLKTADEPFVAATRTALVEAATFAKEGNPEAAREARARASTLLAAVEPERARLEEALRQPTSPESALEVHDPIEVLARIGADKETDIGQIRELSRHGRAGLYSALGMLERRAESEALDIILAGVNSGDPDVAGRALWVASRFAEGLNDQQARDLEAATRAFIATSQDAYRRGTADRVLRNLGRRKTATVPAS